MVVVATAAAVLLHINIFSPLTCVHPGRWLEALVGWVLVAPSFPGRGSPRLLPEVGEALELLLLLGVHLGLVFVPGIYKQAVWLYAVVVQLCPR